MTAPGQIDIFGGVAPQPSPEEPRKPPLKSGSTPVKTCWDYCVHVGKMPLGLAHKDPRKRVFRTCSLPGREHVRCFEQDVICQHAQARVRHEPVKPRSPGWDDY